MAKRELPKEVHLHARADMERLPPEPSIQQNVIKHAQADLGGTVEKKKEEPAREAKESGVLGKAAKAVAREAVMPALEKLIPQGAAEIVQALGIPHVPYGPTEKPVPIEEEQGGVYGKADAAKDYNPADYSRPAATQGREKDQSRER